MFVAIGYGGYDYLLAPQQESVPLSKELRVMELKGKVKALREDLQQNPLHKANSLILKKAGTNLGTDPFLKRRLAEEIARDAARLRKQMEAREKKTEIRINYTGYLQTANTALAIIDGSEYQLGEELESGGYIVQSIAPEKVVLRRKEGRERMTIAIAEE